MRRVGGFAAVLVLAGVLIAVWWTGRPAPTVGAQAVRALQSASPPTPTSAPFGAPAVPTVAATVPTPQPVTAPRTLTLPSLGVTAAVEPTGVDERGEFAVPPSVDVVGWYRLGPGLDEPTGSVVLGGHVDSATDGPGAFRRLAELEPGDEVLVTGQDGGERRYRVVAREQRPKQDLDLAPYFARDGAPRLTLFTCGGDFDSGARSYSDNVIVTAVPV